MNKRAKPRRKNPIMAMLRRIHEELHREDEQPTLLDFLRQINYAVGRPSEGDQSWN